MKLLALLTAMTLVMAASASASPTHLLRGEGVTLSLPAGWHGLVSPAGIQVADFPLPQRARSSANLVRVRRGHVHLIVFNYGPWVPYLHFRPSREPLLLSRRNLTGAMEGFGANDTYAVRTARLGGEMLEFLADLGPKPFSPSALRRVNAVLVSLRVLPSRVLYPSHGQLAADGLSLPLLPGWTGSLEIPADQSGVRVVLRAARGNVDVNLLEYAESYGSGRHLGLPVALTNHDMLRSPQKRLARLVFSNGGRSFDLTTTVRSPRDLREENRLLARLAVSPRPWTFRCCNLALRLPGTWRAALRPRPYPVIKLRGPGVLAVLAEMRPGERASGRIVRRGGRRFGIDVTPQSAQTRAEAVLATLHVTRHS
jgi:hypothetical protein